MNKNPAVYRKNDSLTMLRPKTKAKGMLWEFHKGDDDNYPSVPHGHALSGAYKLQLWNGYIFDVSTGKHVYTAKKKDMIALKKEPGFLEFVEECRKEYRQRNPVIVLPELDCHQYGSRRSKRKRRSKDSYQFYIRHDRA